MVSTFYGGSFRVLSELWVNTSVIVLLAPVSLHPPKSQRIRLLSIVSTCKETWVDRHRDLNPWPTFPSGGQRVGRRRHSHMSYMEDDVRHAGACWFWCGIVPTARPPSDWSCWGLIWHRSLSEEPFRQLVDYRNVEWSKGNYWLDILSKMYMCGEKTIVTLYCIGSVANKLLFFFCVKKCHTYVICITIP